MFLRIAMNNLWRNKRRTLITELSIVFGMMVIIFTGSLTKGMAKNWAISGIEQVYGSMQVEQKDYEKQRKFRPLETSLSNSQELINKIEAFPQVTKASGQLVVMGFVSNGSKSTMFWGRGVDIESRKIALPRMNQLISEGRLINHNANEILLGRALAKNLNLKLGESVMVLASTIKGGLNMVELVYVGTLWAKGIPDAASAHWVEMNLATVQKLLRMPDKVSQITVAYKDFYTIVEGAQALQKELNSTSAVPLVVKDYTKLIRGYEITEFFNLIGFVVGFVLFIIVGAGIANSMFMAVMERRKEIGTMKAIGADQWTIKRLFIMEGMTIGVVGAFLGLISGMVLVWGIGELGGVPLPPAPGSSDSMSVIPILNYSSCSFGIVLALVISVAASYLPASMSSKLDPVETLRVE